MTGWVEDIKNGWMRKEIKKGEIRNREEVEETVPLRLGKGVFFSLAALLGRARLDRLKLVPWFLYKLPTNAECTIYI